MVQKAGVLHILTYKCVRATAACHFWTSHLQKVVRTRQFLNIFTSKCASRHSRVPFLNIGTSKMAPTMRCFVHFHLQMCFAPQPRGILEHRNFQIAPTMRCFAHFHLQMCFAPQPRAIFEHRNFQNGSANVVFCAFWLATVLRTTAACNFSTSELQKVLRHRQFFTIFTCKCAFRHSRVPFFTCPLHSYLRTRRFSEATFRTSGTTNHWKNTAIRDVPNIFHTCTFFQVTLHACASPWSWLDICCVFDTSTLLFNSAYCRKLDF